MNWWEAAPLASQQPAQAPAQENWWEAAPLAAAASQGEAMGPIEAGLVGAGNDLTFGHPGAVAEFLRGPEGRAEVEARVAKARQDQPTAFDVGGYMTYAIPGGGAVKGTMAGAKALVRAGPRIAETGLRAGGLATRWGGGLSALLHGNLPGAYVAWEAGQKAKRLANVLKARRTAASATTAAERVEPRLMDVLKEAPKEGPTGPVNLPPKLAEALRRSKETPGTGALSAEMKAALKRRKFRHDYSTGEWADLLAPGE